MEDEFFGGEYSIDSGGWVSIGKEKDVEPEDDDRDLELKGAW